VRLCLSPDELNWSHFVLMGGCGGLFCAITVEDDDTPLTYQYLIHSMNRDNYGKTGVKFSCLRTKCVDATCDCPKGEPFLVG